MKRMCRGESARDWFSCIGGSLRGPITASLEPLSGRCIKQAERGVNSCVHTHKFTLYAIKMSNARPLKQLDPRI